MISRAALLPRDLLQCASIVTLLHSPPYQPYKSSSSTHTQRARNTAWIYLCTCLIRTFGWNLITHEILKCKANDEQNLKVYFTSQQNWKKYLRLQNKDCKFENFTTLSSMPHYRSIINIRLVFPKIMIFTCVIGYGQVNIAMLQYLV